MPLKIGVNISEEFLQVDGFWVKYFMFNKWIFVGLDFVEGVKSIFQNFPTS